MRIDRKKGHIFEGGGGKGVAYLGVSKHYEEEGYFPGYVCGVSAGSIYALFIALGYTYSEINSFFLEEEEGKDIFSTFYDMRDHKDLNGFDSSFLRLMINFIIPPIPLVRTLIGWIIYKLLSFTRVYRVMYSLRAYGGIFKGEKLRKWILSKIRAKIDKERPTFRDLFVHNGVFLCIGSTNISSPDKQFCLFNYRSSPDLPLDEAVMMSSAIPFFFENREWKEEFGRYGIMSKDDFTGNKFVDGGLMSNAPIWVFLDKHMNIVGEIPEDLDVTCFVLDETMDVAGHTAKVSSSKALKFFRGSKVAALLHDVFDAVLASDNIKVYSERDKVCRIPCSGYKVYAFDLCKKEREMLVLSSIVHVQDFMASRSD